MEGDVISLEEGRRRVVARSNRPEVRNPLLELPEAKALQALGTVERKAMRELLMALSAASHQRAEKCWVKRKGPLAVYHRAVGVYAKHAARLLRDCETPAAKRARAAA